MVNDTGLSGKFDYAAASNQPPPDFVFDFAHQLGMELMEESRLIEMLVVRKAIKLR